MTWSLACPDWADRIASGRSLIPDLQLFEQPAKKAVSIFNKLRLPDVPGTPTMEEASGDWFREIVATIFGSHDAATQERFIREFFVLVTKKNSKTTGGGAVAVTALLMNERPRGEGLFVGPTQAISDLAYSQAAGMIEADEYLRRRFHIREHKKEIIDRTNAARVKVKTFAADILTGPKPIFVILDEVHLLGQIASASKIIGQLRGGMIANPEAFMLMITTQSDMPPAGAFRAELMAARMIRDGKATGTLLPILYEFPLTMIQSGAWRDPANWWMVTPNRDKSITIDRLKEDWEKAQLSGDEEIRRWASQHLNVEIGIALQSDRWSGAEFWESAADKTLTLDEVLRRSEIVVVGIDGGGLDDLLGLAVLGRCATTGKWLLWSHAWAHEIVLERRKEIVARLRDFKAAKELTIVKRPGEDVTALADIVMKIEDAGLLAKIGVDTYGIGDIIDELTGRDIAMDRIVGIPQGWKMNAAIKTAERKLAGGELLHGGTGLMAWAVGNAKVEPRGNAISITKQAAGSAKIDPLMAAFNAVAVMAMNPEPSGGRIDDFLESLKRREAA